MNTKTTVTTLLAALIVTASAAGAITATQDNVPDDPGSQGDEPVAEGSGETADRLPESASETRENDPRNSSDVTSGAVAGHEERGPPVDLPAHIPDHIREIHEAIRRHLAADFDMLGEAISGIDVDGEATEFETPQADRDESADGPGEDATTVTPTLSPTATDA